MHKFSRNLTTFYRYEKITWETRNTSLWQDAKSISNVEPFRCDSV